MKQQITKEQWDELKESKQIEWLAKFYPENKDIIKYLYNGVNTFLPIIGQMIEFLGKDWWDGIILEFIPPAGDIYFINRDGGKLCDSLWEATKDKLDKINSK